MDEEQIKQWLAMVPGSKRGADGVIIEHDEGFFYVTDVGLSDPDLSPEEEFFSTFCAKREVLRLRELSSAEDYLLRLRANAIADSPRLARVMAARRRRFEKSGGIWSLGGYYRSLNAVPKRYIQRLPRAERRKVKATAFGYAPISEANAVCMGSLVGEIVLVSEALRYFYYFATIASLGDTLGVDMVDRVDALLIALRIMNGSESADFEIDPRERMPRKMKGKVDRHVEAMLEFTFGHEFAHLLLGHVAAPSSGEQRVYTLGDEFAADSGAIRHANPAGDARTSLTLGAYSVLLNLHLLELVSAEREDMPDFSVSTTHPRAADRIWSLRDALGGKGQPSRREIQRSIDAVQRMKDFVQARIAAAPRPDLMTFYGSIHLAGLGGRPGVDRIDF